jgi:probable DNA repair protein
LNDKRVPQEIAAALSAGAGIVVPTSQRQASLRAAWAEQQRAADLKVWATPKILTLAQLAEARVHELAAGNDAPDELLPPSAEWAAMREWRLEAGGIAEARALLAAVRTAADWQIPTSSAALGDSPEAALLVDTVHELDALARRERRRPLRAWMTALEPAAERSFATGFGSLSPLTALALEKSGASILPREAGASAVTTIATADEDDHEIDLIAGWCRAHLERDPSRRLLVVDARLRARRRSYERVLSQTLSPREWVSSEARRFSTVFAIEGGQPLTDFPLIAHALLTLRLLTSRLAFSDLVRWLRLPFLDSNDVFAGAAIEAELRKGRQLEFAASELASYLDREGRVDAARALASRLRRALVLLPSVDQAPSEWSPRLLAALREVGWHGTRALRSDEQQTVARWHALLDEYSALGAWLPRTDAAGAVATLRDLAEERSFDPASVAAPITLTDSHEDPIVRFDGIWVAGLDAAQWPAPPRPDVFLPLRLQNAAGIPWASAAGQTRVAHESLRAWRAATRELVCSWALMDGDAHRTPSPLLARLEAMPYSGVAAAPLARQLQRATTETLEDVSGVPLDRTRTVAGGVRPLELQSECGFRAYAEMRLAARGLESPAPGIDPRDRGKLLHKALELVWLRLSGRFSIDDIVNDARPWRPLIADSVEAAVAYVFRGRIPPELAHSVNRERMRLERLIERLLQKERERAAFSIDALEVERQVEIAGGKFEFQIDRIDKIEGGGYAILDYKSGKPRRLRWDDEDIRDPQLIAYLLAERGRDVQALANVSLASDRATFTGRSARNKLLPGVAGLPAEKIPAEEIDASWRDETQRWIESLRRLAAEYLAGIAPAEPAPDVCRNCSLTILCRRLELARAPDEAAHD